ncbi:MAG TPA: DNA internalization-related competence protein ComEC/Rec2, partial [Myxococcaceae bacterium]|nr:DNA internalization-related competence protein ComEC/Rec2 [Myxococcaceae bacterium]
GEVVSVERSGTGTRLLLAVAHDPEARAVRERVQLWAPPGGAPLFRGQRVLLTATLHPLAGPSSWGEWDWTAAARRRAVAYAGRYDPFTALPASPAAPSEVWLDAERSRFLTRARAAAPSPDAAALYAALGAGLRAELSSDWEGLFARSGLAHVLSVSGLHVAALAVLVLVGLRLALVRLLPFAARRWDARRPAALLALPVLWAYVAFTGWQGPAVRSALMASAVLGGHVLGRAPDTLHALGLAAWAVLLVDPASVADLSLQLSFLAVLALVLLTPAVRSLIPLARPDPVHASPRRLRWERMREGALETVAASAAVTAANAPLVAGAFHRISLAGLLSNVVCLPLCGLLTGLAAASAALGPTLPWAAAPVGWAGTRVAWLLLRAVELFAGLPGAAVGTPGFGPWAGAAWAIGLLAFALGRGRVRALSLLAPLAAAAVFLAPELGPQPALAATFLAVGQGDSAVVSSGGVHLLVDGGGSPTGSDPGRRTVLPALREQGIRRLGLVVLSHPHPDHALGLVAVLREIPAERIWLPPGPRGALERAVEEAAPGAHVEEVSAGRSLVLGEAKVEVLAPPAGGGRGRSLNDQSLVLRVTAGATSVLFPGDIEAPAEEGLHPGRVTVVKAPHHGSRTSSTRSLVEETRPGLVVFSVGAHNRFGFPHPEVVSRWERVGSRTLRTDLDGAVRVVSDGIRAHWESFIGAHGDL